MTRAPAVQASRLGSALAQWRRLLGPERVLVDQRTLKRYGRTTLMRAPQPLAVIRPRRAEQVPELLRVARDQRISLYPISRGRNWGWGEACPATERQVVLDLGDLDRILKINAEFGYAVIEPGVTQGQLVRALASDAPEWWLESTNAGPETSIVGNTLERGLGMSDRTASVCGLEVVLPDGKTVRTGFGIFPRSRVTHLGKWGVGPNLDGLFMQSNLGVVTRMGIWLAPKIAIDWGDTDLQAAIHDVSIARVKRDQVQNQKVYLDRPYFRWTIELNWPKDGRISFGAVGYTQTLLSEPIISERQRLSLKERSRRTTG